jgi:hypothetical protein
VACRFVCPYLQAEVELTEEREHHIAERHPDLLPDQRSKLTEVLADPDIVRRSVHAVNGCSPGGPLTCGAVAIW